ncbi:AGE family epimerase/isomerase [Martelella alba]|uniref:AGE family epimerase/isomerase n=1 Tax=Martelella alba TaxID=2590451 RepID=A0A506UJB1_9HYPH|nr:AGE family epimerase/isomerase [Martelella alba]TPW33388.1 AGE family epimerase/isomerase [Martelella alba]
MQPKVNTMIAPPRWIRRPYHRDWLMGQANNLFDYFQYRSINPKGGFFEFDADGNPLGGDNPVRGIHTAARMVHCMSMGHLLGRPGCDDLLDHGMKFLWERHRDNERGGYFWQVDNDGPLGEPTKQAYGHAFVLLAASSAKFAGHPQADQMIADVTEVIEKYFWEEQYGAVAEEFQTDWTPVPGYRGQNCNMHMTEALMAAYEVTGKVEYITKAKQIAELIINKHARSCNFRVAEHFTENWEIDYNYSGNEMFRPSGTTPGHWLEWSRLLLQLFALTGRAHDWMPKAAQELFVSSFKYGWDHDKKGMYYTLDWSNKPLNRSKLWWPHCEAIGATHCLSEHFGGDFHMLAYRRLWSFITNHLIDHEKGGWHEELTEDLVPANSLFAGKGDIYHALQACLIPLYPTTGSIVQMIYNEIKHY